MKTRLTGTTWLSGIFLLLLFAQCFPPETEHTLHVRQVAQTEGLIAFWDFDLAEDEVWASHYDPAAIPRSVPLYLRRIGDSTAYTLDTWPYTDSNSSLQFDAGGPFGKAIYFNQGYLYGAVPRIAFDNTALDIHGKQAFTLIAWVKFVGKRHMVAGIWDEGGWNKYAGRRQVALFGGLFQQPGVIAHISATGAASYPQSEIPGAQYARLRAIDGQAFEDHQWIAMAMTYDPTKEEVRAWLNGKMTPLTLNDPVTQDVYRYPGEQAANPFSFTSPIYSPKAFVLKYNGYNLSEDGISEHRLQVELTEGQLTYWQDRPHEQPLEKEFRISFDLLRKGKSLLNESILATVANGQTILLPPTEVNWGDEVRTVLSVWDKGVWKQIGTPIAHEVQAGAPFTFGRALGLGSEELDHGSQLYLDGVAVFNRVLTEVELQELSFSVAPEPSN